MSPHRPLESPDLLVSRLGAEPVFTNRRAFTVASSSEPRTEAPSRAPLSGADQPDAAVASRALPALSLVEVNRAPGLRNRVVVEVLGDESVLRGGGGARATGP